MKIRVLLRPPHKQVVVIQLIARLHAPHYIFLRSFGANRLKNVIRRSIHRPEVCLQGQGWTILESKTRSIAMTTGRELQVRDLFIERNMRTKDGAMQPLRAHLFYWFVGSDVTTPSHAERIWLTLWDNITRRVNHRWAYVTMMAKASDNLDPTTLNERARSGEETAAMLEKFTAMLVPRFQKSFMDNTPVAAAH